LHCIYCAIIFQTPVPQKPASHRVDCLDAGPRPAVTTWHSPYLFASNPPKKRIPVAGENHSFAAALVVSILIFSTL
jgi:hypothetical protein